MAHKLQQRYWLRRFNVLVRLQITKPIKNLNLNPRQVAAATLPFLTWAIIWLLPVPSGVSVEAWHLLAVFVGTVVGVITRPLPVGVVTLIALVVLVITDTLTIEQGLSGFSSSTAWLTLCSFFIARGTIKTGLGTRLAYWFMSCLGRNTLLLAYGMLATDLILAPAIPSGNARAGGVIFPIVKSLAVAYDSTPEGGTAGKLGGFLLQSAYQGTQITTAMFLTAMVSNPFMAQIAGEMGVNIDWTTWAAAALAPGLVSLMLMPLIVYVCYPPQLKQTPEAPKIARQQLVSMGKVSFSEWLMSVIFLTTLGLWIFGDRMGIQSATTAIIGVVLLLLSRVLTWQEIVESPKVWDIFVWFSIILMMATFLNELGFIAWLSQMVEGGVEGWSWQLGFLLLGLVYFYSNYFFASKAARATAMYPAFLSVAIALGTPPMYAVLVLTAFVNLSGCLTHYGTAEAPIYHSAGYIDTTAWLRVGFLLSLVYIVVWLGVGGLWWQLLGLV